MVRRVPRVAIAACAAGLGLAAIGSRPAAQTSPQKPEQAPTFRTTTNFVQVDAFPTRDGRIIEGLTVKDFQITEDGKPQAIESAEFIRIEPDTTIGARRDPNTQDEGNTLAADPRNRVFVLYLDHYHASLSGSHAVRQPIVTMLSRLLAANDLFGVATPIMKPADLILGRQTNSIEEQLEKHWTWGLQSGAVSLEPVEEGLVRCYGEEVALAVSKRTREERTLESLSQFMRHLGRLREARKVMIVFSLGWVLYEPDQAAVNQLLTLEKHGRPVIGIGPGGVMSTKIPPNPGMADWAWCSQELQRAFMLDNRRRYRLLIDEATRANVAFYPVHLDGLAVPGRADSLRTLAENSDGLMVATNDFNSGLRRIVDDMSAYYMLGYYSTNTKFDGNYRRIDVKVLAPGASVKARRGYVSPPPDPKPGDPGPAPKPGVPSGVAEALGVLSRLRPSAEVFTYGVATPTELSVVVELASGQVSATAWAKGAEVHVTPAGGAAVTGRIEAGWRAVHVRLPRPAGPGPFRLNVKVTGTGVDAVLNESVEIAARAAGVLGDPIAFRAAPAPVSPLRPVADYQFWRTERVHVEWPVQGPLDRRQARLLSKDGSGLAVPVTLSERDSNGRAVLAADLNLAPLAVGDYVIEVVAAIGTDEVRRYVPIRVLR